jgi:hypothetical protein
MAFCPRCKGRGRRKYERKPCEWCKGEGVVTPERRKDYHVKFGAALLLAVYGLSGAPRRKKVAMDSETRIGDLWYRPIECYPGLWRVMIRGRSGQGFARRNGDAGARWRGDSALRRWRTRSAAQAWIDSLDASGGSR